MKLYNVDFVHTADRKSTSSTTELRITHTQLCWTFQPSSNVEVLDFLRPCIFDTWDVRLANTRRRRADETPILSLWQPLSTAGHRCHQGLPSTSIAWGILKLWEKSRFACWKSCPCPGRRLMSGFIPGSPAMDPATLVGGGDCNAHSSARNVDTRVRTIHGLPTYPVLSPYLPSISKWTLNG